MQHLYPILRADGRTEVWRAAAIPELNEVRARLGGGSDVGHGLVVTPYRGPLVILSLDLAQSIELPVNPFVYTCIHGDVMFARHLNYDFAGVSANDLLELNAAHGCKLE